MACSKFFSGVLPELTNEIIQYFRNDFSTLHSCILVNRLWCRLAIPLLWEDPFSKGYPKNYHFIDIYLHKLNDDDKMKLNEYGINTEMLPSNILFNYSSYIKCLNTYRVRSTIETWAINAMVSNFDEILKLSSFIFISLINIFIKNEANLYTFEFRLLYDKDLSSYDCFNSAFQLILQNPNFICNVKNLKIYLNSYSDLSPFMKCFYSNCRSISSLYVHSLIDDPVEKDLSNLINSQQNLKIIYIDCSNNSLKSFQISNCSNTLKSIIFHKTYLEYLEINFNEIFDQLNVLDSIHILYCYSLSSTIIQQIINLTKPFKLRSLFMDRSSKLQIDLLKLLLQKSGNYLENIGFRSSINNNYKLQAFKLVKIHCIKIKFIDLQGFDDKNIFSALNLIENIQQNLNYLSICLSKFGLYQSDNLSSLMLQNLGQILPNRLEYLSLDLKINIIDLKVFFHNSQNVFIRRFLIREKMHQDSGIILSCIKQYVMKEKRVAYLATDSIPIGSNDVDEFKVYGIQVMRYDQLYIQVYDFINELG
ncbi:hypothetical protein C1646_822503 [Rhizophagus diaphanus]|nr:hypothetical protein C1646_822503 [Rhizophagus diaphanus] [Rhizophagus sp. MUCL 43196]